MPAIDYGPCRGCGQKMLWVATLNGKLQPLDPEPDPERGNLIVVAGDADIDGRTTTRIAIVVEHLTDVAREAAAKVGVRFYTPHHMTCEANQDRKFNR